MQLPLKNPPREWKVSRSGLTTVIARVSRVAVTAEHVVVAAVAGCFPVGFLAAAQFLSSRKDLGEILMQPLMLGLLVLAPVMPGLVLAAKWKYGREYRYLLRGEELRIEREEEGKRRVHTTTSGEAVGLRRYVPLDIDEQPMEGASLVLDRRDAAGEVRPLYLGLFVGREAGEWFVRLFEAWSGRRAEFCEYLPDDETDDDEL